jgi:predicted RNA-binding protein associated with RNAse of E/G family
MAAGYHAVWFLFNGQPFDVARFYRPDGTWTGYYADVLEPVNWDGNDPETLQPIVDLFLDLWIAPDGKHLVLDADEFEDAVSDGYLSEQQIDHARSTLQELIDQTAQGLFPPPSVQEFKL